MGWRGSNEMRGELYRLVGRPTVQADAAVYGSSPGPAGRREPALFWVVGDRGRNPQMITMCQ